MRLSLFALLVALFTASAAQAAPGAAGAEFGLTLPNGARRLEEGRYRIPRSYNDTLKFFKKEFAGDEQITIRKVVSLPGVKAHHLANADARDRWEGINLYELRGEVKVFILARQRPEPTATKPSAVPAPKKATAAPPTKKTP